MDQSENQNPNPIEPSNLPQQPTSPQAQGPPQVIPVPQVPVTNPIQSQSVNNLVSPEPQTQPIPEPQVQLSPQSLVQPISQPQPTQTALGQPSLPLNQTGSTPQTGQVFVSDGGITENTLPNNKKSNKWILVIIVAIVVLGGAGSGFYLLTKTTPTSIFNKTLSDALSTSQVEQVSSGGGSSVDIKYNLANVQNPITSGSTSISIFGLTFNLNSYGTRNDTFIEYTSVDASGVIENNATTTPFLDKWVQVRDNGNLPAGGDGGADQFIDPRYQVFGQFIFGNFTASERKTILNYVETNNIYQFNPKDVTNSTLNGNKVLVYPISLNVTKLMNYNDKVASILNYSNVDISNLNQGLDSGPRSATLYIDPSTDRLLKVTATSQGSTVTTTYSNYNDLTLPEQPVPVLTYAQLIVLENKSSSSL